MCDLGNTENDTYKYPNIIEGYEKSKKLFTGGYIFFREKVTENTVSDLLPETINDIQNIRDQSRE